MAFLKTLFLCLAVVVVVLFSSCEAREFVVGKDQSWKIPSDPHNYSFNQWASGERFVKGDHLIFKYDGKTDSVLEVTLDAYKSCDASKPLKSYNDGYTTVELNEEGPFYFISGNKDNCEKGEKLKVVLVNSHHHGHHGGHIIPAPAPSTSTWTTPAPEPTTHAPAPAPASAGHSLKNGFLGTAGVVLGLVFWV